MQGQKLNGRQQTFLDVFRIIAAFFVVFGHSFSIFGLTVLRNENVFPFIQRIGVSMLLLLSGFLSAYSMQHKNRNHDYRFGEFVKHKTVRIMRELIPGLIIITLIDIIHMKVDGASYRYADNLNVRNFVGNVFMLQNMGPDAILKRLFVPYGSGRPLWTLAVEWWLYMFFGIFYLAISNKEKITFPKLILMILITAMISNNLITGGGTLGFIFFLGVAAYHVYDKMDLTVARVAFPVLFIGYIAYCYFVKDVYTVYAFLILCPMFCAALKCFGGDGTREGKRNKVLSFLSKGTFMLYLTHYSILYLSKYIDASLSKVTRFSIAILLSMAVAYGAFYVFGEKKLPETLFNRLFRRFLKKKDPDGTN